MGKIKDRIIEQNRYRPTAEMRRRATRARRGLHTVKKTGDLCFDEAGRCFQVTRSGTIPYARSRA